MEIIPTLFEDVLLLEIKSLKMKEVPFQNILIRVKVNFFFHKKKFIFVKII